LPNKASKFGSKKQQMQEEGFKRNAISNYYSEDEEEEIKGKKGVNSKVIKKEYLNKVKRVKSDRDYLQLQKN
jgi:hypothetical protein